MNVLVVGAHASSILFLACGTLFRYAQAGHGVTIAEMCSLLGEDSEPMTEAKILKRETEARQAATLVPAEISFFHPEASDNIQAWQYLRELILKIKPEVIITHDPADYYICHKETSEMVAACGLTFQRHGSGIGQPPGFESPSIVYMDTMAGIAFEPEEFVDISAAFELKCRMLACFETETATWQDHPVVAWLEWMGIHSRYRGIQAGVRYAEAFRRPRRWGHLQPRRILP